MDLKAGSKIKREPANEMAGRFVLPPADTMCTHADQNLPVGSFLPVTLILVPLIFL